MGDGGGGLGGEGEQCWGPGNGGPPVKSAGGWGGGRGVGGLIRGRGGCVLGTEKGSVGEEDERQAGAGVSNKQT